MTINTFIDREKISESIFFNCLLALSGGYQDAYTFFVRDGVFSNAQTGNVVLLSQNIMTKGFFSGIRYLVPIIAFAFGVIIAELIFHRFKESERIRWRQIILMVEIATLAAVGFIPLKYNMVATMLVSFSCAMQVQAFRKVNGYPYASTMCIGNLRSGTEALASFIRTGERKFMKSVLHYYGIIFVFGVGAGLGGVLSTKIGVNAIWITEVFLILGFVMLHFGKDK